MAYKIAVCDDEEALAQQIQNLILEIDPFLYQVEIFTSGEQLLASGGGYPICFLDIDMPGMNGIETARRLREKDKKTKLIYLTSYSDYVRDAFGVHAFAYLIKPAKKEEIQKQLQEALSYMEEPKKELAFQTEEGIQTLEVNEIYCFEYRDRKILAHTKRGNCLLRGKITELAARMEEYHFSMPHKSFIVNLYHVKNIKGYDIWLTDGETVPLSQKKAAQFRQGLTRYLSSRIL